MSLIKMFVAITHSFSQINWKNNVSELITATNTSPHFKYWHSKLWSH